MEVPYHVFATSLLMSKGAERTPNPASRAKETYSGCVQRGGSSIPSICTWDRISNANRWVCLTNGETFTFNRLDVIAHLLLRQVFGSEPIRNHQLSPLLQQSERVPEKEGFVWEMAHGLGYPDAVETVAVREEVAHCLGVQLQETRGAVAEFYGRSSSCDGFAGRTGCGCCFREIGGHLDLFAADGDAGDMAAVVQGEMARRTPDAAPDVEDRTTLF